MEHLIQLMTIAINIEKKGLKYFLKLTCFLSPFLKLV